MTLEETAEASSARYNCCRIVRLSSGAFVLFSPHSNDDGIELLAVGTPEEVCANVWTVEQCDDAWSRSQALAASRRTTIAEIIGIAAPQTLGLKRRA